MNELVKKIFIGLGIVIGLLALVRGWQLWRDSRQRQQTTISETQLYLDRQAADNLVRRLENLQTLKDSLVLPQVELSIKL